MGRASDRLIQRRYLSPRVSRVSLGLWARAALQQPAATPAGRRFRAQFGCDPPWFITVSPGHACNLRCSGCYADSTDASARLPWPVFDRIICEAHELWGAPLVVLSGGEPLAYRDDGHDILDAVEAHGDCMFLMFTQAIRKWQRQYNYGQAELREDGDWLRPCPIRDHYAVFRELVQRYGPEPEDEAAREALADAQYGAGLAAYDEALQACTGPVWEGEYLG